MSMIKEWMAALCAAGVIAGLMNYLKPNNQFEKVFSLAVSAVLICVAVAPFTVRSKQNITAFEVTIQSSVAQSSSDSFADRILLSEAAEAVQKQASEALEKNGYTHVQVEALMHINDERIISIKQIILRGDDTAQVQKAAALIKKEFQVEVTTDEDD